jgi:hypothetical protein
MHMLAEKILTRLDRLAGMEVEETIMYKITSADSLQQLTPDPGVEIAVLPPQSATLLQSVGHMPKRDVEQRFRRGDLCYVARADGRIAHYSWVQHTDFHPIEPAGIGADVAAEELWIYHCRTADWAKGRRIYPCTLSRILRDYMQRGFWRAIIYTTRSNIASQKGILRAGFKQDGVLRAFRLGDHYFPLR